MSDFSTDYRWQMKFLPTICGIVGPLLLSPAPLERDMRESTDLMMLQARDKRIGCRMRREGAANKWPWDFTIRSERENGSRTELQKIIDGDALCDWMFYGHALHDDQPTICRWLIINIASFRAHLIYDKGNHIRGNPRQINNNDGTRGIAFDVRAYPQHPPILIDSSHRLPNDNVVPLRRKEQ